LGLPRERRIVDYLHLVQLGAGYLDWCPAASGFHPAKAAQYHKCCIPDFSGVGTGLS
jgi:hypothetical protein